MYFSWTRKPYNSQLLSRFTRLLGAWHWDLRIGRIDILARLDYVTIDTNADTNA